MSLNVKYRPMSLSQIVGQSGAVAAMEKFAANPSSRAFLLHGETGTGKTSAAVALAAALGCCVEQAEFGGVTQIPAGEQTADAVRQLARLLWNLPFYGSGWRVVVVNECDYMSSQAQAVWLDVLENLPTRCCVVFSTNDIKKLSKRFRDRCRCLEFVSSGLESIAAAQSLADRVWKAEGGIGRAPRIEMDGDCISYRSALNQVESALSGTPEVRKAAPVVAAEPVIKTRNISRPKDFMSQFNAPRIQGQYVA